MSGAGPPEQSDTRGDLALLVAAIATRLRRVVTDRPASAHELRNTVLDCVRALEQLAGERAAGMAATPVFGNAQTELAAVAKVQAAGAASVHNGGKHQRPRPDGP